MKLTIIFLLLSFSSLCQTPGYKIETATVNDFIPQYKLTKTGERIITKKGKKKIKKIKKKQLAPTTKQLNEAKSTKSDDTTLIQKLKDKKDSLEKVVDTIGKSPKYHVKTSKYTTKEWVTIESNRRHIHYLDSVYKEYRCTALSIAKKNFDPDSHVKDTDSIVSLNKLANSALNLRLRLKDQNDSLYRIYMRDYVAVTRSRLFFGAGRSRAFFDLMYSDVGKDFNFANSVGFNLGNGSGSLYSEIASGNLGIVRASFGLMISQNSDTDSTESVQRDAYQRLISNGGNTVLKFEYPLYYLHSRNFKYNLITKLNLGFAADLPAFGTNTEKFAGNASFGIDLYGDLATDNNMLRFFIYSNLTGFSGTKEFQQNLGTINSNFLHGQFSVGIVVNKIIKISVIVFAFSSEPNLRNPNIIVGGQVLP